MTPHRCEPGDVCGDVLADLSVCYVCLVCRPHGHGLEAWGSWKVDPEIVAEDRARGTLREFGGDW